MALTKQQIGTIEAKLRAGLSLTRACNGDGSLREAYRRYLKKSSATPSPPVPQPEPELQGKNQILPPQKLSVPEYYAEIKKCTLREILSGLNSHEPWAVKEAVNVLKLVDESFAADKKGKGRNFTPDDYKKIVQDLQEEG